MTISRSLRSRRPRFIEALEPRQLLSSTVVPLAGGQKLIHDGARGLLYVPVGTSVQRVDVASRSLLAPITGVGTALRGGDITPDGSRLYLADSVYTPGTSHPA